MSNKSSNGYTAFHGVRSSGGLVGEKKEADQEVGMRVPVCDVIVSRNVSAPGLAPIHRHADPSHGSLSRMLFCVNMCVPLRRHGSPDNLSWLQKWDKGKLTRFWVKEGTGEITGPCVAKHCSQRSCRWPLSLSHNFHSCSLAPLERLRCYLIQASGCFSVETDTLKFSPVSRPD
ncbi:hypothetical protein WMY93_020965 [Mugilogobius chulae]|uniref:Uncharacterized protein n=1 Tax=Mugilogobius chulae TaxID=88201 RepID=A0AAW0NAG5_9GOBI